MPDEEDIELDEFTLLPEGSQIDLFAEQKIVAFSFPEENDAIFFYELWNRYADGEFLIEFQQKEED